EAGSGEYQAGDLARVNADWVEPLGIDVFGHRLWTVPPNSQGYLTLASARIAELAAGVAGLPAPTAAARPPPFVAASPPAAARPGPSATTSCTKEPTARRCWPNGASPTLLLASIPRSALPRSTGPAMAAPSISAPSTETAWA